MKKFVASLLLVSSFSVSAYAVDPVTAGLANIGKNPSYNDTYVGFWKTGAGYSLLTNGASTYLNAPATDGTIYFKAGYTTYASMDRRSFAFFSPLAVNTDATVSGALTANGGIGVFAPRSDSWTGFFAGGQYGISATGSTIALESDGPFFANGPATVSDSLTVYNKITLSSSFAYKQGGGSWMGLSDVRVKKDIVDFDDGLAEIEKVRSVRYRYNGLGGSTASEQQYIGVIAQELETTAPYMVSSTSRKLRDTDAEPTDIKEVDPSAFTYLLINAVQELSEQNKAMKQLLCKDHPKSDLCKKAPSSGHVASRFVKR